MHTILRGSLRRGVQALIGAAALTLVACNNDVNFNPAAPTFSDFTPLGRERVVEISGRLTAVDGSCLEATVLYDGQELAGARTQCPSARGCNDLELTAEATSSPGHHTVSFQVLHQSPEAVSYFADGEVRVSREGLATVATLPLRAQRATLRTGERLSFEVVFWN